MSKVLVTGGSGFVAAHVILRLLADGYRVATTVRSLAREERVRAMLRDGGMEPGATLSFFAADLTMDAGWAEAVAGCDNVIHVASPFPPAVPEHEDELIVPARDGTLRVLRAARDAGVRRVVLTSSFAAIGYGHAPRAEPFDETAWSNLEVDVPAYMKSKTLAERAAWDFVAREGGGMELASVNPVGIFGPVLGPDFAASIQLVKRLMDGIPAYPRLHFGVVDVRDVADLHLRAMADPAAAGERFLAVAGEPLSIAEVAAILRRRLGAAARRVPRVQLPDWAVRLLALCVADLQPFVPQLGVVRRVSAEKARRMLGWSPRSSEEAIVATAESLIRHGVVKAR